MIATIHVSIAGAILVSLGKIRASLTGGNGELTRARASRAYKEVPSPAVASFALGSFLRASQAGVILGDYADRCGVPFALHHVASYRVITNIVNHSIYLPGLARQLHYQGAPARHGKCATLLDGTLIAISPVSYRRLLTPRAACLPCWTPIVDNPSATAMALPLL